jgi:hypothetical protein
VRWLRVGNMLLHLFQSGDPASQGYHFGIKVNDFEDACIRLKRAGARCPDRVSLLLKRLRAAGRDQSRSTYVTPRATWNMVEVNWPDVSTLACSMSGDIEKVDAGNEEATLYLDKR